MTKSSLEDLRAILETSGLRPALHFLNGRVPHRYTIVYRFDGEAFYGMCVVDKLREPVPALFIKVPFQDSFCQYTVADGAFKTNDTMRESRLAGHLHQVTVQSYCGLPLLDPAGALWGTFCHLDTAPQVMSEAEYEFLQHAMALLGQHLPIASELADSGAAPRR